MTVLIGMASPVSAFSSSTRLTKPLSYGGLVFTLPKAWPIYTAVQTEPCGVRTPAVVLGNGPKSSPPPCTGGAIPQLSTLVHVVPAGGAQGTYSSVTAQRVLSQPGMTNKVRTFTHEGVRVWLETTLISGKVVGSPTTVPPSEHLVWDVEAYFKGYPVFFDAGSAGGSSGGSLQEAMAVVDSVRPASHG